MQRTKKPDIVVEAARYAPDGQIAFVRAYERRGNIWSDCLLLSRAQLLERLKKGQVVLVGQRRLYLGSDFEFGGPIRLVGQAVVLDGQSAGRDHLPGVPLL